MYNGQLNTNYVVGALFNQIMSIRTYSENVGEMFSAIADKSKVDGSLFGDTKLYNSLDIPGTHKWGADAEASNLLELKRPKAPYTDSITMSEFRQAFITIDDYLTKQAFMGEGTFSQFNSTVVSTMRDAKRIYDTTTWNTFVGTERSAAQAAQDITIDESKVPSLAQGTGAALAKLLIRMKDNSRDFNDLGFVRAIDPSRIQVIWNADYVVDITKYDLPAIFHKEDIIDKFGYENALPSRFFGNRIAAAGTSDGTQRTLVEMTASNGDPIFPGDVIPKGVKYNANEAYAVDPNVIAIVTKTPSEVVPMMSGMEVGTNFFNPRSLTETEYVTWGHNKLHRLADAPWVLIRKKAA